MTGSTFFITFEPLAIHSSKVIDFEHKMAKLAFLDTEKVLKGLCEEARLWPPLAWFQNRRCGIFACGAKAEGRRDSNVRREHNLAFGSAVLTQ